MVGQASSSSKLLRQPPSASRPWIIDSSLTNKQLNLRLVDLAHCYCSLSGQVTLPVNLRLKECSFGPPHRRCRLFRGLPLPRLALVCLQVRVAFRVALSSAGLPRPSAVICFVGMPHPHLLRPPMMMQPPPVNPLVLTPPGMLKLCLLAKQHRLRP